ncbi:MAG: hypothetical protein Fur0037_06370 [Planctomycetota bacterium]
MTVERFLGGAWFAVHGPADPNRAPAWVLEAGFRGLLVAPGPREVDWVAIRERAREANIPLRWPGVRVASQLADVHALAPMASPRESEQREARASIARAAELASRLGTEHLILEPGLVPVVGETGPEDLGDPTVDWTAERAGPLLARRKVALDAALDRVCRFIHDLLRALPDFRLSLTTGRNLRSVADLFGLEAIFEDLGNPRLGYWHDASVVARRAQIGQAPQGEWLERNANRLTGASLADASSEGIYLPPGSGGVDWALLAPYVRSRARTLPIVLDLDPAVDRREIPGMLSFSSKFGL